MGWTSDQVRAEVRSVVAGFTEVAGELAETTELVADLGIDSLGVMEVVAEIEDRFEMTISDAQLLGVTTLADVASAIRSSLVEQGRLVA